MLVVAALIALAGCGSSNSPSTSTPRSSPAIASQTPMPASPATRPPPSLGVSPIPTDDGLLAMLPVKLDGLDRHVDPSVNAAIATDPDLARLADSFATALYVDPASSQFAYVSVVRLQGRLSDAESRSYRDSFDAAACSQAGGLERTAEATIGSHRAYIGTCAGGVRTYHVELDAGGMILSVSEAGDRRLAEHLIRGLG
jgi:hypothetical protein